jgi:hypothetical protein
MGTEACICLVKKRLNPGDEMNRGNLNTVVFVRDEFRRIMPTIEFREIDQIKQMGRNCRPYQTIGRWLWK